MMPINTTDYFALFDLSPSFELDEKYLEYSYHRLQMENHPDKFSGDDEASRMQAVQATSLINGAYETLKSPLMRAGYLLSQKGLDVEKVSQADLDMDLLMEQMQMREALAELPKDSSSLPELEELKLDVKGKLNKREQDFTDFFGRSDFVAAKKVFHEMQFLFKLLAEIDAGEELRLGY